MKHSILLAFLFCTFAAHGQNVDLIVTTTGDSLRCKIVEVTAERIQFRFEQGTVIPIGRSEVASYQYNFSQPAANAPAGRNAAAKPVDTKPAQREKKDQAAEKSSSGYRPFYTAFTIGGGSFGSAFEEIDGTALNFGLDFAYFFIPQLAAGLKLNFAGSQVSYEDYYESLSYYDFVSFYGPALYGRFPMKKFAFAASLGLGGLKWSISDVTLNGIKSSEKESYSAFGGFISAGVNYMFTQHVGIGANLQSMLGTIEEDRKVAGLVFTVGICARF